MKKYLLGAVVAFAAVTVFIGNSADNGFNPYSPGFSIYLNDISKYNFSNF